MEHIKWVFSGLGVAILSALFVWLRHRRQAHVVPAAPSSPPPAPALQAAVADLTPASLPFKAIHYRVQRRIALGDYCDLPIRPDYLLRATLNDIREFPSPPSPYSEPICCAEFTFSSRWVFPGAQATETGRNRFLIPPLAGIEETQCVYGFVTQANISYFFRVCVPHVNPQTKVAEIDFVVFRHE